MCGLRRVDPSPLHSPAQASRPGVCPECNSHRWQCIRRATPSLLHRTCHRRSWWCQQQQTYIWGGEIFFFFKEKLWFYLALTSSQNGHSYENGTQVDQNFPLINFLLGNSLTFLDIQHLAFLLRVRWEDWYRSHVRTINETAASSRLAQLSTKESGGNS